MKNWNIRGLLGSCVILFALLSCVSTPTKQSSTDLEKSAPQTPPSGVLHAEQDSSYPDSLNTPADHLAKGSVVDVIPNDPFQKIGIIELISFYPMIKGQNTPHASDDIRQILEEFKKKEVSGVILDLRGNLGGSLMEAVKVAGLFIESGGVVQATNATGDLEIETDPDPGFAYAGPLAVLVDHGSAAASEIVAAAIQDYKRGIIVGERTFGNGTNQTLVDLGRFVKGRSKHLGYLRLTMKMLFRPEGSGIQQRGVEPDIVFPTDIDTYPRERTIANSLPWSRVDPIQTKDYGFEMAPQVLAQHSKRINSDNIFRIAIDFNRLWSSIDNTNSVSLKESQRIADQKHLDQELAKLIHIVKDQKGAKEAKALAKGSMDETLEKAVTVLLALFREAALRETVAILSDCIKAGCYRD